eukprot:11169860-Lingulodinium_polyedra.AAC.1
MDYARPPTRAAASFLAPDESDLPLGAPAETKKNACQGAIPLAPATDRAVQRLPGDAVIMAIGAGAHIALRAAGEQAE